MAECRLNVLEIQCLNNTTSEGRGWLESGIIMSKSGRDAGERTGC